MTSRQKGDALVVLGIIATLILMLWWSEAYPRDLDGKYANSPHHEWFQNQHNSVGQWCCNEADGHPYYDDYKFNDDGSVTVYQDGQKVQIESYKVLKGGNPTGAAVWWYVEGPYGRTTFCFAPGQLG